MGSGKLGVNLMKISDKQKGILFILLAGLGFALMGLFVNLSGDIPTMEKG